MTVLIPAGCLWMVCLTDEMRSPERNTQVRICIPILAASVSHFTTFPFALASAARLRAGQARATLTTRQNPDNGISGDVFSTLTALALSVFSTPPIPDALVKRASPGRTGGSGANRLIGPVKVAIQSIWWAAMSKGKGLEGLFDGRHFDREIIVLCVRWYLRYKLSLRDLVEMMAERGLSLAHTTIMRG
jgi:hypothetical protein